MALEGKTTFKTDIATGTSGDRQGDLGHATIHNNIGSVLNNLQDDVGTDGTADTTTLKYKVANVDNLKAKSVTAPTVDNSYAKYNSGTDNITWEVPAGAGDMLQSVYDAASVNEQVVGLTATQTLTNKTLTSPAGIVTNDVTESTNKNYVTDAQQTVIGNTSGTNTGDQTSIVGISGTTAEFNTALSDGSFATGGGTATGTNTGDEVAASLTVAGVSELATTAEIDTGTDSTRTMPVDQFVASNRNVRYIDWRVLGSVIDQAVATSVGGDFEFPFTGTIVSIGAYVDTAGTTGTAVYDVNIAGATIMTTNKITIDTTEKSSRTAATAPTLTTTAVTAGDIFTTDIDTIHTTPAKGLVIRFGVRQG